MRWWGRWIKKINPTHAILTAWLPGRQPVSPHEAKMTFHSINQGWSTFWICQYDSLMAWRASVSAMGQNKVDFPAKRRQIRKPIIYATRWWNRDLPMLSACSLSSRCKLLGSWPASLIFCPTKRIADMQNGDRWRRLKGSHNFASAALPKPSLSQSKKNGIDAYLSQESLEGSKTGMKECAPRKNLY